MRTTGSIVGKGVAVGNGVLVGAGPAVFVGVTVEMEGMEIGNAWQAESTQAIHNQAIFLVRCIQTL
jgi:hypothetical protein